MSKIQLTKKQKAALWSLTIFAFVGAGTAASLAWFEPTINYIDAEVTGSVVEAYFHCGSGTQADPYVITRPIHYYHMVEFFQRITRLPKVNGTNRFGTDYLYFQVGYDFDNNGTRKVYNYDSAGLYLGDDEHPNYSTTLNMAYYSGENALMPIGTNEIPFIGSFDGGATSGGGITIANLNIHCSEDVYIEGTGTATRTASDIGIFGYVADKDGSNNPTVIQNAYFTNLTIDLSDVSSTVGATQTSIAHVDAHAGTPYVGYIAGHVHTYTNYSATGPTDAAPIHNVYVDHAKVEGGPATNSNYGFIGKVDSIDGNASGLTLADQMTSLYGGGGQGSDWGGSIAFDSFNQRLHAKLNPGTSVRFKKGNTTYSNGLIKTNSSSQSAITVFRGGSASTAATYLANDPASNYVVYNMIGSGTHSINNKSTGSGGTTYTATSSVSGTFEPLLVNNDYTTASANTGYLTSSQYAQNGSSHYYTAIDGTVRSASYPNGQIANSISDTHYETSGLYNATTGGPKLSYNGNKLEVLTNSSASYSASNFRLIGDDYNSAHTVSNSSLTGYTKTNYETLGLTKYEAARDHLETVLTGSQYVHGIHFMGQALSASSTVTVPSAIINGESKTNYPVLLSSVDFNVKEKGHITLFAGAYYPSGSTTTADSFFELHKVNRNGDAISSIQKIYKIYEDSNGDYNYTTTANGTGTGTLVFDMNFLMNAPPKNNVVYYFEIPVGTGEFALGAVSGKTAGAYLFYLDLSASGDNQTANQGLKVKDTPLFTQIGFSNGTFVTNSCFNVAYIVPTGSDKNKFSIEVYVTSVTYDSKSYTCYELEITNTSNSTLTLDALLVDNDSNPNNDYLYMYAITYNGGTRTQYLYSDTFTAAGTSGTTSMTPAHTHT